MAKKTEKFSYLGAVDQLEILGQKGVTADEFIYELLRIFAEYGDGRLARVRDGVGNASKDGQTILIKNLIAYRAADVTTPDGDCEKLFAIIEDMLADPKITKQNPRLFIVSNGEYVAAYDPRINDWYDNSLQLLWKDCDFLMPLAGIEKVAHYDEAEADVKSAELMAKLFDDIRRYNDIKDEAVVHSLNVFMSRLLFCFFAEDTDLFPGENLFTNTLANNTKADGSDLSEFIDRAFLAMSMRDEAILDSLPELFRVFPYVNGGLFKNRYPIPFLSRRARTLIINCGEYDWKDINPDIFGSMIQAVITPQQRAGLGMHYTSVPNIEKVIYPLFLDSLREEFKFACAEAKEKMARRVRPELAVRRLQALLGRLYNIRCFDPACGSGNFLIIAYKRMRQLEIEIWEAMRDLAHISALPISNISLTQFYGIELDPFACDTATLSLWLAEHQMNVKFREAFGVKTDTLPLKPSGNIVCGNACRLDWNTVCPHDAEEEVYIMGNPPYLGSSLQSDEQKEDMRIAVEQVCKGYKKLDYIATWFIKAAAYCSNRNSSFAFVTTNSISQGEQVPILWPILLKNGLEIFFAYTSFKWANNAKYNAGVTVAIIGMSAKKADHKLFRNNAILNVPHINAYLNASEDCIIYPRLTPISKLQPMIFGSKSSDGGFLILSTDEKERLLGEGIPEKFIKRYVGSEDSINGFERFCIWVEDDDVEEAQSFAQLNERFEGVKQMRLKSTKKQTQEFAQYPYKFTEIRYENTDCLVIPRVSSERRQYIPFSFYPKGTVVDGSSQVIYGANNATFGIINSRMHNLWVCAVGGRLETRIRYSATLCYNTFPFPKLTTAEKEELERLAQNILNIREENFDMTLGEMYNPETMPEELLAAHKELDLAVERIYRSEPFTSDEERLEHLFKLYAKMTKEK